VHRLEAVEDLEADVGGAGHTQDPFVAQQVGQRPAFEQLHHDPDLVVGLDLVVDGHHVLVLDLGQGLGLAPGPVPRRLLRVGGPPGVAEQPFHGDEAVQPPVVRPPDLAHSAAADRLSQLEAVLDHGVGGGRLGRGPVTGLAGPVFVAHPTPPVTPWSRPD
jgi:hypothetical protein